ncbi:Fic family protein [Nocardia caishijiensis]|uniref:Fic family protein n=1 Tax=Nocardia caishijiensis TaxID=184756 RepID=UPI0012ECC0A4|nr:Fic family protein [Nocardia caishijiensis]
MTANVHAMEAATSLGRDIDTASILAMHRALLGESDPAHAGRWRDEQVWADFVPPHHDRVPAAIVDLIRFTRRDDLPALVHLALAHAQFETIHPFADGNGRTGRALVHAMLSARQLTGHITVPISAGLLVNTGTYFDALTGYRTGDPEPIVRRFVAATFYAVGAGRRLVEDLRAVRTGYREQTTARADSVVWKVIDSLLAQPVVNSAYVAETFGISAVAAQRAIDRLVQSGVLREVSQRARNRVWQADAMLTALDDFAAGIGRARA